MTEDVDPNAIHESLAELERRSVRLRAVAVAVLFVLLLVSLLSLAFTIATAIRTANIIERASAAETERGRELAEARRTVDQIEASLTNLERAVGISTPSPPPDATPTPSSAPDATPASRDHPPRVSPTPSNAPPPSPTPTPMCVLQFCV